MITYMQSNQKIVNSDAEALINFVNCEGLIDSSLNSEFKNKYKESFKNYQDACLNKSLSVCDVLIYRHPNDKYILSLVIKDERGDTPDIHDLKTGLTRIVNVLESNKIKSVAISSIVDHKLDKDKTDGVISYIFDYWFNDFETYVY